MGLLVIAASMALIGCSGEDGEDGQALGILYDGCACLTGVDLSQVGITVSVIYLGEKYKLEPGPGRIYWSTSRDSIIWYFDAEVEKGKSGELGSIPGIPGVFGDGDDGKDRVYELTLGYGTYNVVEYFALGESPPANSGPNIPNSVE
jgi:hypothetical protein